MSVASSPVKVSRRAADPLVAPLRILAGEPHDQLLQVAGNRRRPPEAVG